MAHAASTSQAQKSSREAEDASTGQPHKPASDGIENSKLRLPKSYKADTVMSEEINHEDEGGCGVYQIRTPNTVERKRER
jgi:hypothetical protein